MGMMAGRAGREEVQISDMRNRKGLRHLGVLAVVVCAAAMAPS